MRTVFLCVVTLLSGRLCAMEGSVEQLRSSVHADISTLQRHLLYCKGHLQELNMQFLFPQLTEFTNYLCDAYLPSVKAMDEVQLKVELGELHSVKTHIHQARIDLNQAETDKKSHAALFFQEQLKMGRFVQQTHPKLYAWLQKLDARCHASHAAFSPEKKLIGHNDAILSIAWSPDGKYLASGSLDKTVRIWDLQTGSCIQTLAGEAHSIVWSPRGNYLSSCNSLSSGNNGEICIWESKTWSRIQQLKDVDPSIIAWSHDGAFLAYASSRSIKSACTIHFYDFATHTDRGTLEIKFKYKEYCQSLNKIAWSLQDNRVAIVVMMDINHLVWRTDMYIIDVGPIAAQETETKIIVEGERAIHTGIVYCSAWNPDGTAIATGGEFVKIWDGETGSLLKTFVASDEKPSAILSIVWKPDGETFTSRAYDGKVRVWDKKTGECIQTMQSVMLPDPNSDYKIAESPDGKYLAVVQEDYRTIAIYAINLMPTLNEVLENLSLAQITLLQDIHEGAYAIIPGTPAAAIFNSLPVYLQELLRHSKRLVFLKQ